MIEVRVTLPDDAIQPFESQVREFEKSGKRGIEYAVTSFTRDELRRKGIDGALLQFRNGVHVVESLLFRDKSGKIRGILHHHPEALPPIADAHEIQICVEPRFRNKGVASALLCDALERWPIDLSAQQYTAAGAAFIRRFLAEAN